MGINFKGILLSVLMITFSVFGYAEVISYSSEIKLSSASTVKFEVDKDDNTYTIKADTDGKGFKELNKEKHKNLQKVQDFIVAEVKKCLQAIDTDNLNFVNINQFSRRFTENAVSRFTKKNDSVTRELSLGEDQVVQEYFKDSKYTYTLIDNKKAAEEIINFVVFNGGVYKFTVDGLKSDLIQNNVMEILAFIKLNKENTIPDLVVEADNFKGIFYPTDSIQKIPIIAGAKEKIKSALVKKSDGNVVLGEVAKTNGSDQAMKTGAETKKDTEIKKEPEKKRHMILGGIEIKCKNNFAFEVSAITTGSDSDVEFELVILQGIDKISSIILKNNITDQTFIQQLYGDGILKGKSCETEEDIRAVKEYLQKLRIELAKNLDNQKLRKAKRESDAKVEAGEEKEAKMRKEFTSKIDVIAGESENSANLEVREKIPLDVLCNGGQIQEHKSAGIFIKTDSVILRVSENVIQVDIIGEINGKMQTLSNKSYGLKLRDLFDGNYTLSFYVDGIQHTLCYSNVFFVRPPNDGSLSFNLRDGVYRFLVKDSIPVKQLQLKQKSLLDFISASAFIDFLSFDNKSSNKNVVTELYLNIPVNTWRFSSGHYSSARYINANVTLSANLFKDPVQFQTLRSTYFVSRDSAKIPNASTAPFYAYFDSVVSKRYYLKTFDLIKNAFFQIRPVCNILSFDAKPANAIIDINAGGLVMASNGKFVDPLKGTDSIYNQTVLSYSFLNELRIRVFPKPSFGFDLRAGYYFGLHTFSPMIKGITGDYDLETLQKAKLTDVNKSNYFQGEVSLYFNPKKAVSNTDRGGFYLKGVISKAVHYDDGFFSFMIGYSTDIKNFFR